MTGVIVSNLASFGWKFVCEEDRDVSTLKRDVFDCIGLLTKDAELFYLSSGGRNLTESSVVKGGQCVYILPRLLGGKGGFGSMLRAIGAQIEKTTNREACRDLSGRRLRDINEEMRLKKWIAKQAEKEQDKAKRRIEKLQRKLAAPRHEFNDPEYDRERSQLSEKVNDALSQGLAVAKSETGNKRPATDGDSSVNKKPKLWLDFTQEVSSDDDDESESDSDVLSSVSSSSSSSKDDVKAVDSEVCNTEELAEESPVPSISKTEPEPPAIETETKCQVYERLDLDEFKSIEELEALGLDGLKSALLALGLKCGGTLRQRAERLFSVKGLADDQIKKNLTATKRKQTKK